MEQRATGSPPGNPRWLVILVAVMGAMIVIGVAVIAVEIGRRLITASAPRTEGPPAGRSAGTAAPAGVLPQLEVLLPPGARLLDASQSGQYLTARLQLADGSMAVWLIDLATGRVASRVTFKSEK